MEKITVNFGQITGAVKPMNAVNNGPSGSFVRKTKGNSEYYKALEIPFARTHDSAFNSSYGNSSGQHIVDIHRIFPNFDADENDPKNYIFAPTDDYMASINAVGTKVFYRLGSGIEHGYKLGTYPPKDYHKWARICEKIIRRYTQGLWDGFNYDIEYWEIWNEPDCKNWDGSQPCWQGTLDEFIDFYEVVSKHLKSTFPHLKIGGPAFTYAYPKVCDPFFSAVVERKMPLDFFSFHLYCYTPDYIKVAADDAYALLKKYGLENTETSLNEWNYIRKWTGEEYSLSMQYISDYHGSAFVAGCMSVAQKTPLDSLMYYDARPSCLYNGLFDPYGKPQKPYYAFAHFRDLRRLKNAVYSSDGDGVYTLGASDGKVSAIMLSCFVGDDNDKTKREITLEVKGLKKDCEYLMQYFVTDKNDSYALKREERIIASETELPLTLDNYSINFIKFIPLP